jgi:hypothetical protein
MAKDFLQNLKGFSDTCNSCKFFQPTTSICKQKKEKVAYDDKKCEKWRYGG